MTPRSPTRTLVLALAITMTSTLCACTKAGDTTSPTTAPPPATSGVASPPPRTIDPARRHDTLTHTLTQLGITTDHARCALAAGPPDLSAADDQQLRQALTAAVRCGAQADIAAHLAADAAHASNLDDTTQNCLRERLTRFDAHQLIDALLGDQNASTELDHTSRAACAGESSTTTNPA